MKLVRWIGLGVVSLAPVGFAARAADDTFLKQSRGKNHPADIDEWRRGEERGGLKPYPPAPPGTPNPPGGIFQFGGSSGSSFGSPDLGMPFATWRAKMEKQRPSVDKTARAILESRFALDCKRDDSIKMSRGKPQPIGPTAKLPKAVKSWEEYA